MYSSTNSQTPMGVLVGLVSSRGMMPTCASCSEEIGSTCKALYFALSFVTKLGTLLVVFSLIISWFLRSSEEVAADTKNM